MCHEWLERIGSFLGVDCVRVFTFLTPGEVTVLAHWKRPGLANAPPMRSPLVFHGWGRNLLEHLAPQTRERVVRVANGARQRVAVEHVSNAGGVTRCGCSGLRA